MSLTIIMFRIVLLLFFGVSFVSCYYEQSGGIEIQIGYNETSEESFCMTNSENYFEENQSIFISYKKAPTYTYYLIPERCYMENNEKRKFGMPTLMINKPNKNVVVSVDMGTKWTCEFRDRNMKRFSCYFPVYVRCREAAKISINNEVLETSIPNNSVTEYDVESKYTYFDDELVYITCALISGIAMKFGVIGFNNESLIPPTDYIHNTEQIHLRAILNEKYNLSYIDCIVKKTPNRDAIHRIFMVPKGSAAAYNGDTGTQDVVTYTDAPMYTKGWGEDTDWKPVPHLGSTAKTRHDLLIRVNGLILAPISDDRTASYYYEKGEQVNITCEKLTASTTLLILSFGDNIKSKVKSIGPNIVTVSINTFEINESDELLVTCRIMGKSSKTLPLKEAPKNDVIIRGLLQRYIIFAYRNSNGANVITYEYKDNEVLNLTWMFGETSHDEFSRVHVILIWKDKLLVNSEYPLSTTSKNITSQMIHLSPQDDGSIIQCIVIYSRKHTYESWIILSRKLDSDEGNITGKNELQWNSQIILPVICVSAIIIALAVLSIIFKYYRKYKRFPKETDESNEVNDITQSSTQFPESWDEYANAMISGTQTSSSYVDLKCLYAKPIPKKDRQLKDQVVIRENSLYEPLEHDGKDFNKNVAGQKGQNCIKPGNPADKSCINYGSPNQETELYSEVSLTG